MTLRPRAIRAVVRARTRMRDLAAATEARALTADTDARTAAERAADQLDAALCDAAPRLAASTSINDLYRIAGDLACERIAVMDTAELRVETAAALERASVETRMRERQRRTVERALDELYAQRAKTEAREEQVLTDDLGGRRRLA